VVICNIEVSVDVSLISYAYDLSNSCSSIKCCCIVLYYTLTTFCCYLYRLLN